MSKRACDSLEIGHDTDLLKILKDSVTGQINASATDLKQIFDKEILADLREYFSFAGMHGEIVDKSNAEIAFYVAAQKKGGRSATSASHHYCGTVGAIQHGAGSTATVTQTIGNDDAAKITAALEKILQEIRQSPGLDPRTRTQSEMVELVQSGEAIVRADAPNRFKISGLIAGLKNVVENVPKAKDACDIIVASAQTLLS